MAVATTVLIRSLARAQHYSLSQHAEEERQAEQIRLSEIESALREAEIIEHYPGDVRGPSCLALGFAGSCPLHLVCAVKDAPRELLLITVYDPSLQPQRWEADFRRRRTT